MLVNKCLYFKFFSQNNNPAASPGDWTGAFYNGSLMQWPVPLNTTNTDINARGTKMLIK